MVGLGFGQCIGRDLQTVGRNLTDMAFVVVYKSGDAQNTLLGTGSSLPHDDVNGRWYNPSFSS
jgi:hypothetical protein